MFQLLQEGLGGWSVPLPLNPENTTKVKLPGLRQAPDTGGLLLPSVPPLIPSVPGISKVTQEPEILHFVGEKDLSPVLSKERVWSR